MTRSAVLFIAALSTSAFGQENDKSRARTMPVLSIVSRVDASKGEVVFQSGAQPEKIWRLKGTNRALDGAGQSIEAEQLWNRLKVGDPVLVLAGADLDPICRKLLKADAVILLADPKGAAPLAAAQAKDDLTDEEREVIELVNAERKKAELAPLKVNAKLMKAARDHSANMASKNQFAHELDGKTPFDRIKDLGYKSLGAGENVAQGQRTPQEAMTTWMGSEGHRANILNGDYNEIGVGLAKAEDGTRYWTQVFARAASSE